MQHSLWHDMIVTNNESAANMMRSQTTQGECSTVRRGLLLRREGPRVGVLHSGSRLHLSRCDRHHRSAAGGLYDCMRSLYSMVRPRVGLVDSHASSPLDRRQRGSGERIESMLP